MKTYTKIFGKLFAQIWIFILASLVFTYGVLLLTDLKNYELIVENFDCSTRRVVDESGNINIIVLYIVVTIDFIIAEILIVLTQLAEK